MIPPMLFVSGWPSSKPRASGDDPLKAEFILSLCE